MNLPQQRIHGFLFVLDLRGRIQRSNYLRAAQRAVELFSELSAVMLACIYLVKPGRVSFITRLNYILFPNWVPTTLLDTIMNSRVGIEIQNWPPGSVLVPF